MLDAHLAQADRLDGAIGAFAFRDDETARADAAAADAELARGESRGPFHGVPMPIKDLTAVAGWPVTYGSRGAPERPAARDELVVAKLRAAGVVPMGMTATPEFGSMTTTESLRYGLTRNPWDLERSSGGSSGGAAAAVAAGMAPAAHASDGGGSIRIPAACCGLVGLKPSRGRVPRTAQGWFGASVDGVVTRTVADTAHLLDAIAGPDPLCWYQAPVPRRPFAEEPGAKVGRLRVGIPAEVPFGVPQDASVTAALADAAALCSDLGHDVVVAPEPLHVPEAAIAFVQVVNACLGAFDDIDWERVEPHNVVGRRRGSEVDSLALVRAVRALELRSRVVMARFVDGGEFDVYLSPVMACEPLRAGELAEALHADPETPAVGLIRSIVYTQVANITGLPAISLPLATTADGLPLGIQVIGGPFGESLLLRLAAQLEAARPWHTRRPT